MDCENQMTLLPVGNQTTQKPRDYGNIKKTRAGKIQVNASRITRRKKKANMVAFLIIKITNWELMERSFGRSGVCPMGAT